MQIDSQTYNFAPARFQTNIAPNAEHSFSLGGLEEENLGFSQPGTSASREVENASAQPSPFTVEDFLAGPPFYGISQTPQIDFSHPPEETAVAPIGTSAPNTESSLVAETYYPENLTAKEKADLDAHYLYQETLSKNVEDLPDERKDRARDVARQLDQHVSAAAGLPTKLMAFNAKDAAIYNDLKSSIDNLLGRKFVSDSQLQRADKISEILREQDRDGVVTFEEQTDRRRLLDEQSKIFGPSDRELEERLSPAQRSQLAELRGKLKAMEDSHTVETGFPKVDAQFVTRLSNELLGYFQEA